MSRKSIHSSIILLPLPLLLLGCEQAEEPPIGDEGTIPKPAVLAELSGLAASLRHAGIVYGHNDSGDTARFFAMDNSGTIRATFVLEGVTAVDWEDMASAEVDGVPRLYLSDTGNNDLDRDILTVYRVGEPDLPDGNQTVSLASHERFPVDFPDRNEDVEAMAVEPVSGALLFATRDRDDTGYTRLYRAVPMGDGVTIPPTLVHSLADPGGGYRTKAADWSPGGRLALLQHSSKRGATRLVMWNSPAGSSLESLVATAPRILTLDAFDQAEALCFLPGGGTLLVGGEGNIDPLRRKSLTEPPAGHPPAE